MMTKPSQLVTVWAFVFSVATLFAVSGCSDEKIAPTAAAKPLNDGEVTLPSDYGSWSKYVATVIKPNGQIREIYINDIGLEASKGESFAYGTTAVMELYKSRKTSSGALVKDGLEKVYVMQKGKNYGQLLASGSAPNGEWAYGAYLADKSTSATDDFSSCRGCHAPLASADFMPRYDEHFSFKK